MRVEDRARAARRHDFEVQPRLRRWLPGRGTRDGGRGTRDFDLDDIVDDELSLVRAAARHREAQRRTPEDDAEVAARSQDPSPRIEASADVDEFSSRGGEVGHSETAIWTPAGLCHAADLQ